MRIDTELNDSDRTKVREYAEKHGLVLKRAYTLLIRRGLEEEKNEGNV